MTKGKWPERVEIGESILSFCIDLMNSKQQRDETKPYRLDRLSEVKAMLPTVKEWPDWANWVVVSAGLSINFHREKPWWELSRGDWFSNLSQRLIMDGSTGEFLGSKVAKSVSLRLCCWSREEFNKTQNTRS